MVGAGTTGRGEATGEGGTTEADVIARAGGPGSGDDEGVHPKSDISAAAPQGGTIENGRYVLDSVVYYGTCPTTPDISSSTWGICEDHWDSAEVAPLDPLDAA